MGEYSEVSRSDLVDSDGWYVKYGKINADTVCRICGGRILEMNCSAWLLTVSRRGGKYFWRCNPCVVKDQAKQAGDFTDDRSKPDYPLADVAKSCKYLYMRWLVEGDKRAVAVEAWKAAGDNAAMSTSTEPEAVIMANYPRSLFLIANGEFSSGYSRKHSRHYNLSGYAAHRLRVWVTLAKELRPFLPNISGVMLERIYQANAKTLKEKGIKRTAYRTWLASLPSDRLYPLTRTNQDFVQKLLLPILPKGMAATALRYASDPHNLALKKLGLDKDNPHHVFDVEMSVYNGPKGPRVIISYYKA